MNSGKRSRISRKGRPSVSPDVHLDQLLADVERRTRALGEATGDGGSAREGAAEDAVDGLGGEAFDGGGGLAQTEVGEGSVDATEPESVAVVGALTVADEVEPHSY